MLPVRVFMGNGWFLRPFGSKRHLSGCRAIGYRLAVIGYGFLDKPSVGQGPSGYFD